MRVAFTGKGGSGKTTLSGLLVQFLRESGRNILAIDADINQHLAFTLGLPQDSVQSLPELGNHLKPLKTILRGRNDMIVSVDGMIKTTLPGTGSHLIRLASDDTVLQHYAWREQNFWFMRTGAFQEEDVGIRCFHAKTGATELILNHLDDRPDDWTIVDMTAGADAFASGLFTRFDATFVVVEPTLQSVSVFEQYRQYARDYDVRVYAIGNKIQNEDDIAFLQAQCGEALTGYLPVSHWVRRRERGDFQPFTQIEAHVRAVLSGMCDAALAQPRDWVRYWYWGIHFHQKNALNWGNQSTGYAVEDWIDRDFLQNFAEHASTKQSHAA